MAHYRYIGNWAAMSADLKWTAHAVRQRLDELPVTEVDGRRVNPRRQRPMEAMSGRQRHEFCRGRR